MQNTKVLGIGSWRKMASRFREYHKVQKKRCITGCQIMQIYTLVNDIRLVCYFTDYFTIMSGNLPHMYVHSMTDLCIHELMCVCSCMCVHNECAGLCVSEMMRQTQ